MSIEKYCYNSLLNYVGALQDAILKSECAKEIYNDSNVVKSHKKFSDKVGKYFKNKMKKLKEKNIENTT